MGTIDKILIGLVLSILVFSCATGRVINDLKPVDTICMLEPRVKIENPISDTVKAVSEKKGLLSWLKKPAKIPSSVFGSGKFKNKGTIIYQTGTGNTAASATKPGTMATGTAATATDAKKAEGVVVGDGSQAAAASKGPAVAGEGNTVPITTTEESWLHPLLPYAAGALGIGLLYSLLPLGLAGSGWLWVLLRKGRSREPETG